MNVALLAQILVSVGSLVSVFLAGVRQPGGLPKYPFAPWMVLFASHSLFMGYAIVSGQPGFLLLNVGMIAAAVVNFVSSYKNYK